MKITPYEFIMIIGQLSGCHQMPERSLFFKGKQFPVCARCTGVFLGSIMGIVIYFILPLPLWVCILCCAVMFADWLIQRVGVRKSTNIRRLITGIVCGVGIWNIYLKLISFIIALLKSL